MDLTLLLQKKKAAGYTTAQLSELSGVPIGTLQKLLNGETKSPRMDTIHSLEKVLGSLSPTYPTAQERKDLGLYEAAAVYGGNALAEKKQGEYTVEDYYAWPKDERIELIKGFVYYMEAPCLFHQSILLEMGYQIKTYIKQKKGKCRVFMAPVDVQINKDNKTMVQPDVIIACNPEILNEKNIYGAPDFLAEVLSPSTKRKDLYTKLALYFEAGVREYWIIDPEKEEITVHFFEDDAFPKNYKFADQVPVNIYGGELKICLEDVD